MSHGSESQASALRDYLRGKEGEDGGYIKRLGHSKRVLSGIHRNSIALSDEISFQFCFITPSFVSRRSQEVAKLRLPSILGPLRFWWRALAWSRACKAMEGITVAEREAAALQRVRDWEDIIFGCTRPYIGQGMFTARIEGVNAKKEKFGQNCGYKQRYGLNVKAGETGRKKNAGLIYLAGPGLKKREAVCETENFEDASFRLLFRPRLHVIETVRRFVEDASDPTQKDVKEAKAYLKRIEKDFARLVDETKAENGSASLALFSSAPTLFTSGLSSPPTVTDALVALHLFGGIGSRSRRAYGAVVLNNDSFAALQISSCNPATMISKILEAASNVSDEPPYSAFSSLTEALVTTFSKDWPVAKIHDEMGFNFLRFRGYGGKSISSRYAVKTHSMLKNKLWIDGLDLKRTIGGIEVEDSDISPDALKDHDEWYIGWRDALKRSNLAPPESLPSRAAFGLPHNSYGRVFSPLVNSEITGFECEQIENSYKIKDNSKVSINIPNQDRNTKILRRSSPVIFSMTRSPSSKTFVHLNLRSVFLPIDSNVSVFAQTRGRVSSNKTQEYSSKFDHGIVSRFFEMQTKNNREISGCEVDHISAKVDLK